MTAQANNLPYVDAVQVSAKYAHEKSDRSEEFKETTSTQQTTSFESKAQCTEFQLSLDPYYKDPKEDCDDDDGSTTTNATACLMRPIDESFRHALEGLPQKFDPRNRSSRRKFYDFIDGYGTHVVAQGEKSFFVCFCFLYNPIPSWIACVYMIQMFPKCCLLNYIYTSFSCCCCCCCCH